MEMHVRRPAPRYLEITLSRSLPTLTEVQLQHVSRQVEPEQAEQVPTVNYQRHTLVSSVDGLPHENGQEWREEELAQRHEGEGGVA
jgi:hypothetical protein